MNFDVEIYKLSHQFVTDFPYSQYPELLKKQARPHYCLLIDLHCDYFICVPFRSDIRHNNAYMFKNSARSKSHKSGLDYTKIIIIEDSQRYLERNALVDQDEYNEAMQNISLIAKQAERYVTTYIKHKSGEKVLHKSAYSRLYGCSTLPYFDSILLNKCLQAIN